MESNSNTNPPQTKAIIKDQTGDASKSKSIVRSLKSIVVNPSRSKRFDKTVVSFQYYNSFNYSLLTETHQDVRLTLGVTSSNPGEGKTFVASNFAASLAMGYQKKTVLIDLNVRRPRLHSVFDAALTPGVVEALHNGTIYLTQTSIDHLLVLSAGGARGLYTAQVQSGGQPSAKPSAVGLEQLASFRDIIFTLEQEFDFVIVDLPAITSMYFPVLFAGQLNGLLVVVDTRKTRKKDIEKLFRRVNERQVVGFVFNRFEEDNE